MRRVVVAIPVLVLFMASLRPAQQAQGDGIAAIAHERLRRLGRAVSMYSNDYEDHLDDPIRLFPDYVSDPLVFWHPGDDDAPPVTIDNSTPNAPNSAQVSFLFHTGDFSVLTHDAFIIWDSSPANNGGQFISMITADRLIETIPPAATPTPTKVALAQAHLKRIWYALIIHKSGNNDRFADDLTEIYQQGVVGSPRTFWNPGDYDPMPGDITNAIPDAPNSAHISFSFPGAGLPDSQVAPDAILVQDNSPANNGGLGVNVLLRYGRAELILENTPGDSNDDGHIDLADWAKLQRCPTGWTGETDDDTCRLLDFNRNGLIESEDHDEFVSVMTGPHGR